MYPRTLPSKANGYTLIELSIVLVIIGLVVGGVLAGQHLIQGSQIQAVMASVQQYKSAAKQFEDKYLALPGDMNNAGDLWGEADGGDGFGADCTSVASTGGTATCNGDGNGQITANEIYRFWQHLSNAEMIKGVFSGASGPNDANNHSVIGTNVPESDVDGAGFDVTYVSYQAAGSTEYFEGQYGNVLLFAGTDDGNDDILRGPILLAEDAFRMDEKLDDGRPAYGKIRAFEGNSGGNTLTNCPTSTTPTTAEYNVTNGNRVCALIFNLVD